ncbi:hypothetical protein [Cohnella terricola]|uniref:hypothetical protein n=1 Tax=Cohnella terricola TaxID=1289167 RepID=UPI001647813E|nr:hypothetical protein [Cohnella terricola]
MIVKESVLLCPVFVLKSRSNGPADRKRGELPGLVRSNGQADRKGGELPGLARSNGPADRKRGELLGFGTL